MAFVQKTWNNRISEYPNRRIINDGVVSKVVTVSRDEGTVSQVGDAFNASNMNNLEDRIADAFGAVSAVSSLDDLSDVTITTPTDNQVLRYNADNGMWVNADGGGDYTAGENISIMGNVISVTYVMTDEDAHDLWENT